MDIEKLIEQLRKSADFEDYPIVASFAAIIEKKYLRDAATALSTLQAENAQLRGELEYEQEHANAYHEECGQWEAENEKLRAELEQVKEDWSTAANGLMLMQKKLNKVYRMLYDPLIIVDGGHLRPVKNTSRQQVYKKLVDLQVEMGINRGFPWGEMRMEKKED